jgi:hypothetical protein
MTDTTQPTVDVEEIDLTVDVPEVPSSPENACGTPVIPMYEFDDDDSVIDDRESSESEDYYDSWGEVFTGGDY